MDTMGSDYFWRPVNGEQNIHVYLKNPCTTMPPPPPPLLAPPPPPPPPMVVVDLVGLATAEVSCSYITFVYEIAPNSQYTTCDFSLLYPLKAAAHRSVQLTFM